METFVFGVILLLRREDPNVDRLAFDLFAVALPISLALSGIVAWVLSRRAVAPIRQLSEAARSVSPRNIDERIDVEVPEGELTRLQDELNEALERLEEGFRAQSRFVANAAHELKTPVAVLLAESQLLSGRSADPHEFERFRAGVEEEMRRLGSLVESLLTLARIEQGKSMTRAVPVPVADLLLESVTHCDAVARQREVRLVPLLDVPEDDTRFEVEGDPDLLRTMLDNLVRNAIGFSPPGAAVDVTCSCAAGAAEISVRDRGPGVPPDFRQKLFERYAQAPLASTRAGGLGLGLSIARSVARLHGGRIDVRNCDDAGCVFTVALPLAGGTPDLS